MAAFNWLLAHRFFKKAQMAKVAPPKKAHQNQHYVSQVLLRRFADSGRLQQFTVKTGQWYRKGLHPKKIFSGFGYTQLLINGVVDNSLEDSFGVVESQLPATLDALEAAAKTGTTDLTAAIFENMCWYCAFLLCISPFAKAKAPADFVKQVDLDLKNEKTDLLSRVLGISESDIEKIKVEHSLGRKLIIDSENYLQLFFRIQFVLKCKDEYIFFRHFTNWCVYNSPVDLPISDIALVPFRYGDSHFTILPINPRVLLVGKATFGNIHRSDATTIKADTFPIDEATNLGGVICLSAVRQLASKHKLTDVPALQQRAIDKKFTFTRIVNLESVMSAGMTNFDSTCKFKFQMVPQQAFNDYITSFISAKQAAGTIT